MIYEFDKHLIEFASNIEHEYYDHDYCYGIKFYTNDTEYDFVHNRVANWSRIFIRDKNYSCRDIPFNDSTMNIIPGVSVRKI